MIKENLEQLCKTDNLLDILSYRASTRPDKVAYTFLKDGETETAQLNFAQLESQTRLIASRLRTMTSFGDRVLLLFPSGLDFITAFYGCLSAGVIAVPVPIPRSARFLHTIHTFLEDAQPSVIFTTGEVAASLKDHVPHIQWLLMDDISADETDSSESKFYHHPQVGADTVALLQYTSGSTSKPKGVMVTHKNLMVNTDLICNYCRQTEDSRYVTWLPFFHDMGLSGGVIHPVYAGMEVIIMPPIEFVKKPYKWLAAMTRYKATMSGGPNFGYDMCLRKITAQQRQDFDLRHWQVAINGAEPIRSDTIEQFSKTFAPAGFKKSVFYPCYGLAEATIFVSGGDVSKDPLITQICPENLKVNRFVEQQVTDHGLRQVGCGQSLSQHIIKIVEPDTCRELPRGMIGEIWVSGPSVTLGYWRRDEETQQTFRARLKESDDYTEYLRTGDMGVFHQEELFVTGRLKDMIIIRGQNHYPHDIELTVQKSHPLLLGQMCAAFAIEKNNTERLVVVQEIKWFEENGCSLKTIKGDIQQALMENHGLQLHKVVFVKKGSIPMTSSGKIKRKAVCQLYLNDKLEEYSHLEVILNQGGKSGARDFTFIEKKQRRDSTVVN